MMAELWSAQPAARLTALRVQKNIGAAMEEEGISLNDVHLGSVSRALQVFTLYLVLHAWSSSGV